MAEKDSFCSYCGHPFGPRQPWPRVCAHCQEITFQNPAPVSVVLLPVDGGLLAVRRGIEPRRGHLALPGGYINLGETWQQAGARELFEETGLRIDPQELREFRVRSNAAGTFLIVFSLAHERPAGALSVFTPNAETLECLVLRQPQELAFPLHTEVAGDFFAPKAMPGNALRIR